MERELNLRRLRLETDIPVSKSVMHRELIVRFLCGARCFNNVTDTDSVDIAATKECLSALGDLAVRYWSQKAEGKVFDGPVYADLNCKESGSTLRFLIPAAAAYLTGCNMSTEAVVRFHPEGRLIERPLDDLINTLSLHGVNIVINKEESYIDVSGTMLPGEYSICGNVSSQYISGLLMALPLLNGDSKVIVTQGLESAAYVDLTVNTLNRIGVSIEATEEEGSFLVYKIKGSGYLDVMPDKSEMPLSEDGDWSNGAFLLCAGALSHSGHVTVNGLDCESIQGDKAITGFLGMLKVRTKTEDYVTEDGRTRERVTAYASEYFSGTSLSAGLSKRPSCEISVWNTPDIVPYMAVTSAFLAEKIRFVGTSRLRMKESDRIVSTCAVLDSLGAKYEVDTNTLTVYGLKGNEGSFNRPLQISTFGDHRIAMCAALAAIGSERVVLIDDDQCVSKSFPGLFEILEEGSTNARG